MKINLAVVCPGVLAPNLSGATFYGISIYRKIPFTGKKQLINPKRKVKFIALGKLQALEEMVARHQE